MKDHRQWYTIYGYFKDIPIDPKFIKYVKSLVKEGHNVLIMIKKEDHKTNPKFNPSEKFQAIATALEDEMTQSKITISTVPDTTKIIEWDMYLGESK